MFFSVWLLLRGGGADGRGIIATIGIGTTIGAAPAGTALPAPPGAPRGSAASRGSPQGRRLCKKRLLALSPRAEGERRIKRSGGGEGGEEEESSQRKERAAAAAACGEMSNVRISNGSPTLERMEARQAEYPKPSACRNLFGPVNHEELNRDLNRHLQEMEEAYRRKWNFDFQNHRPLEGRYEWQAVEKGSSPDFYFRPPRLRKAACKSAGRQSLDVNGNCQTALCGGSQGISEDTGCVAPKTDVSGARTDLAEQCTAQRKRPAADGNVPMYRYNPGLCPLSPPGCGPSAPFPPKKNPPVVFAVPPRIDDLRRKSLEMRVRSPPGGRRF